MDSSTFSDAFLLNVVNFFLHPISVSVLDLNSEDNGNARCLANTRSGHMPWTVGWFMGWFMGWFIGWFMD